MGNTERMYGASTNRPTSFFFRLFFLVKSSLHVRLAFIFVFSMEQILRFVLLSIPTELFKGENKQIRRGRERCRLPACGVSSLFLALTRHIFSVLLAAHSGDYTCRQTLNHNRLVEEPELNLLLSACMHHWLRLAIGEPEKSTILALFPNSSQVWSTRLGLGSKKKSLWSTEAQRRACRRSDQSRRREWVRERIFQSLCTCVCP